MKLFGSKTSPYTRKVRIVAQEKGLTDAIELVLTSPFEYTDASRELRSFNPLGKIPTLVTAEGWVIYDSRVICEFLDDVGSGPRLLAASGRERVNQLVSIAQADGVLDAAFCLVMELRRPEAERSAEWIERWSDNIRSTITNTDWSWQPQFGLASIGWVCAIDYLKFRLPGRDWMPPEAMVWRDRMANRAIIALTYPED